MTMPISCVFLGVSGASKGPTTEQRLTYQSHYLWRFEREITSKLLYYSWPKR